MPKVSKTIEVDRSPQSCYAVITDFEKYSEFLEELLGMKVLEAGDNVWTVEFTVKVIKKVDYTIKHTGVPGKELQWELVKGFFKKNEGAWVLEALDDGKRTKITYDIDVEFGRLVPGKIVASLTEKSLPKMLGSFKARIESVHAD